MRLYKYNDILWFSSYLDYRTRSVQAGSHISVPLPITFGVPQESILGPIQFNIFINNLFDIKEAFYANNLQITLSNTIDNTPDIKK